MPDSFSSAAVLTPLVLTVLLSSCALWSCAGDGAGMLCAMPDSFFSAVLMDEQSFKLPPLGDYAVGMVSLSNQAVCIDLQLYVLTYSGCISKQRTCARIML
jgi:hypothetical protein